MTLSARLAVMICCVSTVGLCSSCLATSSLQDRAAFKMLMLKVMRASAAVRGGRGHGRRRGARLDACPAWWSTWSGVPLHFPDSLPSATLLLCCSAVQPRSARATIWCTAQLAAAFLRTWAGLDPAVA